MIYPWFFDGLSVGWCSIQSIHECGAHNRIQYLNFEFRRTIVVVPKQINLLIVCDTCCKRQVSKSKQSTNVCLVMCWPCVGRSLQITRIATMGASGTYGRIVGASGGMWIRLGTKLNIRPGGTCQRTHTREQTNFAPMFGHLWLH